MNFGSKLRLAKMLFKIVQKLILITLSLPWVDFLNDFADWVGVVNFDDFGDELDVCDDGGGDGEDLEFKKNPNFERYKPNSHLNLNSDKINQRQIGNSCLVFTAGLVY